MSIIMHFCSIVLRVRDCFDSTPSFCFFLFHSVCIYCSSFCFGAVELRERRKRYPFHSLRCSPFSFFHFLKLSFHNLRCSPSFPFHFFQIVFVGCFVFIQAGGGYCSGRSCELHTVDYDPHSGRSFVAPVQSGGSDRASQRRIGGFRIPPMERGVCPEHVS